VTDDPYPATLAPMHILVIDDDDTNDRIPWFLQLESVGFLVSSARTSADALDMLAAGTHFDLVCFDHDLGEGSKNGSQIASEILNHADHYYVPRAVLVHSMNPEGAQNIASKFHSYGRVTGIEIPVLVRDIGELMLLDPNAAAILFRSIHV
jgi:CheY-like chemotaxis protein